MSTSHRDQSPDWIELTEEEEKVWSGRPSLLIFAEKLLIGLLIGVASVALFLITPGRLSLRALILLGGLPGWLIVAGVVVWHQSIKYVITSDEIYMKRGIWLWKQTSSCRVDRIQNRSVSRSFIQGILSLGDLELATAGTGKIEFNLAWIPNPDKIKRLIVRLQDSSRDSASNYPQSPDIP